MSQDELQTRVVNIEEHVVGMTTRQIAIYVWGIIAATVFICGIGYGFKYAMDNMRYEMRDMRKDFKGDMKDMENRMNAHVDTVVNRKLNNLPAPQVILQQVRPKPTAPVLYVQRVINGQITFIKVPK